MPELIREQWSDDSSSAAAKGEVLVPEDFAMMFVDANLDVTED